MLSAIILASGFSRRMGSNKLTKKLGDNFLIEYIIKTLLNIDFLEILLVANNEKIIKIGKKYNLKIIFNDKAEMGQSESIKYGINNSSSKKGFMFFVADQPLLNEATINICLKAFLENLDKIIIPTLNKKRKNPVIFPYTLKNDLLKLEGDMGGRNVIEKYKNKVFEIAFENELLFYDIDNIEDYNYILENISK